MSRQDEILGKLLQKKNELDKLKTIPYPYERWR